MSKKDKTRNGNQTKPSADNQKVTDNGRNKPSKPAAPKPKPSYGIIDEGNFWPSFKKSEKSINQ